MRAFEATVLSVILSATSSTAELKIKSVSDVKSSQALVETPQARDEDVARFHSKRLATASSEVERTARPWGRLKTARLLDTAITSGIVVDYDVLFQSAVGQTSQVAEGISSSLIESVTSGNFLEVLKDEASGLRDDIILGVTLPDVIPIVSAFVVITAAPTQMPTRSPSLKPLSLSPSESPSEQVIANSINEKSETGIGTAGIIGISVGLGGVLLLISFLIYRYPTRLRSVISNAVLFFITERSRDTAGWNGKTNKLNTADLGGFHSMDWEEDGKITAQDGNKLRVSVGMGRKNLSDKSPMGKTGLDVTYSMDETLQQKFDKVKSRKVGYSIESRTPELLESQADAGPN